MPWSPRSARSRSTTRPPCPVRHAHAPPTLIESPLPTDRPSGKRHASRLLSGVATSSPSGSVSTGGGARAGLSGALCTAFPDGLEWHVAHGSRDHRATGIPVYLCEPAGPWQRGSDEDPNGPLRRYSSRALTCLSYGHHVATITRPALWKGSPIAVGSSFRRYRTTLGVLGATTFSDLLRWRTENSVRKTRAPHTPIPESHARPI